MRDVLNGQIDNGNLSGAAGITRANLAAAAKPVLWYTPSIIATEESRTNTAFGLMPTPDEVKEVVLPENALIAIGCSFNFKSSISEAGSAAIFIGANQLKSGGGTPTAQGRDTIELQSSHVTSDGRGLQFASTVAATGDVTTGQLIGGPFSGGLMYVFAAAGTYNISLKFKASSGSVTANGRKLYVGVIGATA